MHFWLYLKSIISSICSASWTCFTLIKHGNFNNVIKLLQNIAQEYLLLRCHITSPMLLNHPPDKWAKAIMWGEEGVIIWRIARSGMIHLFLWWISEHNTLEMSQATRVLVRNYYKFILSQGYSSLSTRITSILRRVF